MEGRWEEKGFRLLLAGGGRGAKIWGKSSWRDPLLCTPGTHLPCSHIRQPASQETLGQAFSAVTFNVLKFDFSPWPQLRAS